MKSSEPWDELRRKYLAVLERGEESCWGEIWELFLENPWYQAEMAKHARSVLRLSGAPLEWLQDVEHEAKLILARRLQLSPTLGINRQGFEGKFGAAIGIISRNQCRQALKRLRRLYRSGEPLTEDWEASRATRSHELTRRTAALHTAVRELPEPFRSVMTLASAGFDVHGIARELGLSYWQTYRVYQRGIKRLRSDLGIQ